MKLEINCLSILSAAHSSLLGPWDTFYCTIHNFFAASSFPGLLHGHDLNGHSHPVYLTYAVPAGLDLIKKHLSWHNILYITLEVCEKLILVVNLTYFGRADLN